MPTSNFPSKAKKNPSPFLQRDKTLSLGQPFLTIAPTHPLALKAAEKNEAIQAFITSCKQGKVAEAALANQEKRGMDSGFMAIHPLTKKLLPVWLANFVLIDYGPGAVMSVPAHDQRDFEFANQYKLPILQVLTPSNGQSFDLAKSAYTGTGTLINSEGFNGLDIETAKQTILEQLISVKKADSQVNYRLRDWGISRQRYWGAPIPIIYCDKCGDIPVPEADLPVKLPTEILVTGNGSPLVNMPEFYETTCPKCKKPAKRETDTFDTFLNPLGILRVLPAKI